MKGIQIKGIVAMVGNYGSGKTETSVNLAFNRRAAGLDVDIVDLDLVNPYFRTREARAELTRKGINVILPDEKYMHADLPILSPRVAGAIRRHTDLTILDVGGDDVGATVLASLADSLAAREVSVLQVVNPHRPFTETVEGCLKIKAEIEASAKLKVTGWVSNANLMDHTTFEDIDNGYQLIQALSRETGIDIAFITAPAGMSAQLDIHKFQCPVLLIERHLSFPWREAGNRRTAYGI